MKKLFVLAVLIIGLCIQLKAQGYVLPQNLVLKTKEDYTRFEPDVIKTVDYLQQISWTEQVDRRKYASAFLLQWISGSTEVNVDINDKVTRLCNYNTPLLLTYMGAVAKYILQHKAAPDKNAANAAGVKQVLAKYQMEPTHTPNKDLDKLAALDKDGKLDDWIASDFNKN